MAPNFQATPTTAIAAGAWCAVGMSAVEGLLAISELSILWRDAIFIAGAVVFLAVPAFLFVAGRRYFKFGWRDHLAGPYWLEMRAIAGRAFCWLVGAAIGLGIVAIWEAASAI